MNRGLLAKCVREAWLGTALFALGAFAFEVVLSAVLPSFYRDLADQFLRHPFIQNIMKALLGTGIGDEFGPLAIGAIVWVHPVVLTLIWAQEIVFCTRMPAGEIDRGTIDVLFSLPVSRWDAYRTETAVWLASGAVLVTAALLGNLLGSFVITADNAPALGRLLGVIANLYCLYLAVGGIAFLVSAQSSRRGRAMGILFALVLGSFFLHVLGQFWKPAESILFLGVLHYYQPFEILQSGRWAWGDMIVLATVGAACWTAGGHVLARRNISVP